MSETIGGLAGQHEEMVEQGLILEGGDVLRDRVDEEAVACQTEVTAEQVQMVLNAHAMQTVIRQEMHHDISGDRVEAIDPSHAGEHHIESHITKYNRVTLTTQDTNWAVHVAIHETAHDLHHQKNQEERLDTDTEEAITELTTGRIDGQGAITYGPEIAGLRGRIKGASLDQLGRWYLEGQVEKIQGAVAGATERTAMAA